MTATFTPCPACETWPDVPLCRTCQHELDLLEEYRREQMT